MKNKTLVILIIILLLLIAVVASKNSETEEIALDEQETEEVENDESSETALAGENGVVASASDASILGVWQNSDDLSYVLEFANDGVVREYYARQLTGTGTWAVGSGVLTTTINGRVQAYNITSLSASEMTIDFKESREVLTFKRVEL